MQQGSRTVLLQTGPYLLHWLPDTADGGETFANHGLPFHALVDAGQQVSGLQPAAVFHLRLDPYAVS